MSEIDFLFRGIGKLGAGISENRVAKQAAKRIRQVGEADAHLRRLQGTQLLAEQRVARAKSGVDGPTITDVLIETAELESLDVARFEFASEALADQTERRGRAALFSATLGLSTVFIDEVERQREKKQLKELQSLKKKNPFSKLTAIGSSLPFNPVGHRAGTNLTSRSSLFP